MWRPTVVALSLAASLASADQAPVQRVPIGRAVAWRGAKDGAVAHYQAGGYRITLTSQADPRDTRGPAPVMTLAAPRFGAVTLRNLPAYPDPAASFRVVKADPKADGPSVMFMSYTGGAHCCVQLKVVTPVHGDWRVADTGQWDTDVIAAPKDLDGDGTPDFQMLDNDFYYAFGCFACTPAPPQIFNLVAGAWIDVSDAPRYRSIFRKAADELRPACGRPSQNPGVVNGPCAAYVAAAARAGEFDPAWRFMLAHYDHVSRDWPDDCDVARTAGKCPGGHEITYKTYPDALRAFLVKHGYIAVDQAAAAPTAL